MTGASFRLFSDFSRERIGENFAFSPASLHLAMSLAYVGAREETARQISNTLGFDARIENFNTLMAPYYKVFSATEADSLVDFALGNRLFIEKTFALQPEYVQNVEHWHGGAFESVDFISKPRQAESLINGWVSERTRNRIRELIIPGSVNELTRLVLVNAIYIKSNWREPFNKSVSKEKAYSTLSGKQVIKNFMTAKRKDILWFENNDFFAIELPYQSSNISMVFILPASFSGKTEEFVMPAAHQYYSILEGLRAEEVYMEIPSFTLETSFSVSYPLKQAGILKAFDRNANFSGISNDGELYISDVVQKVFMEVDEKGSEAAAATGIALVTTSMPVHPPQIKEFIANRPFVFVLKENQFNTPLFFGHIVK